MLSYVIVLYYITYIYIHISVRLCVCARVLVLISCIDHGTFHVFTATAQQICCLVLAFSAGPGRVQQATGLALR